MFLFLSPNGWIFLTFFNSSGQIRSHGVSCLVSHSVNNWCYWDLTDVTLARKQKPYCWCWKKVPAILLVLERKVTFWLFSPSWLPGYLTHIWLLLFILDQPFLLPQYKLRGGVSERGFRRFVVFWKVSPRKFLLLIRPLLPSRLPYVFVEGKVIPYFTCSISFFCPLNLIASFQEKSMFLPFTLFIVDVELDLCSLGGTGPG